jgi:hypothetical protein
MNLKPETRKWIYGVIAATVPLLVTLGSLTDEVARQILNILAATLAVGGSSLAIANVPGTTPQSDEHQADAESPAESE